MREVTATKVANVVIGAAALGAVIVVLRVPALRRLAWRLALTTLTGTIPAWIGQEVQGAWGESGRRPLAEGGSRPAI